MALNKASALPIKKKIDIAGIQPIKSPTLQITFNYETPCILIVGMV